MATKVYDDLCDIEDPRGRWVRAEEYEKLALHSETMANALNTIASFAVGNGDVCEIIARRARAAYLAYDQDFPEEEQP